MKGNKDFHNLKGWALKRNGKNNRNVPFVYRSFTPIKPRVFINSQSSAVLIKKLETEDCTATDGQEYDRCNIKGTL